MQKDFRESVLLHLSVHFYLIIRRRLTFFLTNYSTNRKLINLLILPLRRNYITLLYCRYLRDITILSLTPRRNSIVVASET